MVARLPGFTRKTDAGFAKHCPQDCPFRAKISEGINVCQFSLYADRLEPGRLTRLEVTRDEHGNIKDYDWHVPPNCDVYEKYKGKDIGKLKQSQIVIPPSENIY